MASNNIYFINEETLLVYFKSCLGLPLWHSRLRSGIVTAVAWVAAVAQIQSLAWELTCAASVALRPPQKSCLIYHSCTVREVACSWRLLLI